MSTTFKVGDTAEFTENYGYHKVGERFTVTRVETANFGGYTQLVQGREPNGFSGVFSERLKLVETKGHEYKQGDRVQITIPAGNTDTYGGCYFVTGGGTVLEVDDDGGRTRLQVKADTKHPDRNGRNDWWVDTKFVTPLVEELPFEVGARVRSKAGYLGMGSEGTVTRLEGDFGGDIEIAWDKGYAVAGLTLGARRSGLEVIASPVAERPKAIPATDTKPQIGDTIVAFWGDLSKGEVETRAKGVVARIDEDGNYEAADGSCIDWDEEFSPETSDSVFIVERAPKPEPVKVLPEQFLLDAPVGECAHQGHFVFVKSSRDAWKLILSDGAVAQRTSAELLEQYSGIKIIK